MLVNGLNDMLRFYAILFGGLSCAAIAVASLSQARFRACLKAPLSRASGEWSEMWAEMFTFWHKARLGIAGVSILCTALWCIVETAG
jgi:hypothetical protein